MKTIHKMSRSRKFRADKTCECQLLHSEHMLEVRAKGDISESASPAGGVKKFFLTTIIFFLQVGNWEKRVFCHDGDLIALFFGS